MNDVSTARRVFPGRSFLYVPEDNPDNVPPVRIEVRHLRPADLLQASAAVVRIAELHYIEGKDAGELIMLATREVLDLLRPCVSVPDAPEVTIDDIPLDALPEVLEIVLGSLSPGKWKALGRKFVEKFGLREHLARIRATMTETVTRSEPSPESEPSAVTSKTPSEKQ